MLTVQKLRTFLRGSTIEQKHSEKKMLHEWCFHPLAEDTKEEHAVLGIGEGKRGLGIVNCKVY